MYIRSFFFIIFLISNTIFLLSSFKPHLIVYLCGSICKDGLSINYIQISSMVTSALSVLIFAISNYYTEKKIYEEIKRVEEERKNIEEIHAELKALFNGN